MQSNKRFYLILLAVVVVVAGFWFLTRGNRTQPPVQESRGEATSQASTPQSGEAEETQERRVKRSRSLEATGAEDREDDAPRTTARGNGVIKGTAKDANGNVLTGVSIQALRVNWKSNEDRPDDAVTATATTASDGTFAMTKLPTDGPYGVIAVLGELASIDSVYLSPKRPEAEVELKLSKLRPISGTVVDGNGDPVKGAALYAVRMKAGENGSEDALPQIETEVAREVTDEAGAFEFGHVPPGRWKFMVKAKGFAPSMSNWVTPGTEGIQITMTIGGSISGKVVDAKTHAPLAGITVTGATTEYRDNPKAESNADGDFMLANLRSTEYVLGVKSDTLTVSGASPKVVVAGDQKAAGIELALTTGGTISGRVYDGKSGKGIPNAKVRVDSENRGDGAATVVNKEGISDDEGAYTVVGLPGGTYMVMISETEGYGEPDWTKRRSVNISAGTDVTAVDFALDAGVRVAGTVVDDAGNPIADAQVNISGPRGGRWANGKSGPDGHFEVANALQMPEAYLRAEKKGFSSNPVGPIEIPAEGKEDVEIVMGVEASIEGVVVDKSGNPVARAQVVAWPKVHSIFGLPVERTNDKGEFKIGSLAEGDYQMSASPNGSNLRSDPDAETVHVNAGQPTTGVKLVLDKAAGLTIKGRVTNESGKPVDSANLWASGGTGYGDARTDSDGKYEISGLSEGSYTMQVNAGAYSSEMRPQVDAGSEGIDFVLKGRGAIEGTIVDASTNKPVTSFEVQYAKGAYADARQFASMGPGTQSQSDTGAFRVEAVEAGDATLMVRAQGYAPTFERVQDVEPNKTKSGVVIRLEAGGAVAGHVVDSTGKPVPGASIYDGPVPMQDYLRERAVRATSTADGSFLLEGLKTGSITISAYHTGFAGASVQVETQAGRTTNTEIILGGGGNVHARVTENGVPASQAYVGLQAGNDSMGVQTQADGTAEIKNVAAGTYHAYCGLQSGGTRRSRNLNREITVAEGQTTEVTFDFTAGTSTIEGTVLMNGQPPKQANVNVRSGAEGETEMRYEQVDSSGTFRIEDLPAGPVQLTVSAVMGERQNVTRVKTIELGENATERVDFELGGGGKVNGTVTGLRGSENVSVALLRGRVAFPSRPSMQDIRSLYDGGSIIAGAMVEPGTGTFTMEGVEPGECTVIVSAFDGQPTSEEDVINRARFGTAVITVADGETANASVTLP